MNADVTWCHDCDEPAELWSEFVRHASAGHCVGPARCPGTCQFVHKDAER